MVNAEYLRELVDLFVACGWTADSLSGEQACLLRATERLLLFVDNESASMTYYASTTARAKGGSVLRSGRPALLGFVGLMELIQSS